MESCEIDKFTKCGFIYKSPEISDKCYIFLSCIHCGDISWDLKQFMCHTKYHQNHHPEVQRISGNLENQSGNGAITFCKEDLESSSSKGKEKDPLGYGYDVQGLNFADNKATNLDIPSKVQIEEDMLHYPKEQKRNKDVESFDDSESDDSLTDENFEPEKVIGEHSHSGDEVHDDNEFDENDGLSEHGDMVDVDNSQKTTGGGNIKQLSKNRAFIRALIDAYKEQDILWNTSQQSRNPQKKLEAYKTVLENLNGKYNTSATTKQIEVIIKRLRLRFIHQYRKMSSGIENSCYSSSIWFYDQLKFIEPHISGGKKKSNMLQQLKDDQLQLLIKILRNNECLWNEHNIYHTSIMYRQDALQDMTHEFNNSIIGLENVTVNDMKSLVGELLEMAIEENRKMLTESDQISELNSSPNRFYKEIQFLLPHVGPFKCIHCNRTFVDVYTFKFHVAKHEGTKPFKCMYGTCQKELTHKKEFMCHLRRHTKECPFQCEFCDKSFPSRKEWQRHIIKHGSKPYVCELCADSFYTKHQLTNHMKTHANIRDHVCPQCGKGFTHRGLLRQHLQTHNKNECLCRLCNNVYANPRSLRKHYVRIHEVQQESSRIYNCKICSITFPTDHEAKQHRKEHRQSLRSVRRKHICDICGNDFAYPRNLADHMKIHSNIRDQVCSVCGKAFTNSNLLNQHKNVHDGQKFVCKACGRDYAHYRGLCRHISKAHGSNIRDLCGIIEKEKEESSLEQV